MVKKLILLGVIILQSLTASSQTDTSRFEDPNCKTTLPCHVAKQIAIDLTEGDAAKATLVETEALVQQLETKITLQDSVEAARVQKEKIYNDQITVYKAQQEEYQKVTKKLKRSNKALSIGVKVLGTVSGAGVIGTIVGFLLK